MNSEMDLLARVRGDLRAAGYPLVVTDIPLPTTRKQQRLDLVAFAADSTGALRPTVVVEIRQRAVVDQQRLLDQLALARDILGTRHHYVVTTDGWLEADGGLRHLRPVDRPAQPDRLGGELRDAATAELVMQQYLRSDSSRHSNDGAPNEAMRDVRNMLVHLPGPAAVPADETVPMEAATRWRAVRDVVRRHLVRDRHLEPLLSKPGLARPLAQLLGDAVPARVHDPFAGIGAFLWAVADRALEADTSVYLTGTDINATVVELAAAVGALCPLPLQLRIGDSFRERTGDPADAVITQPPLGLRLPEPFQLSSGAITRDGELAAIDVALNCLRPGGRAVLHLSRGWTWRSGEAARYRAYLAQQWRVAGLLGLPAGVYAGTSIPSTILIVDRSSPSSTFVANLEGNWAEELADGGEVLTQCLQHMNGQGCSDAAGGADE